MDNTHIGLLFSLLAVLLLLSGFFSSSETAMMALNRYRLKHLARQGHRGAKLAQALLERPDRLIGVILIGNNFVNNFAATLATIIAIHYLGDTGIAVAPIVLTLVVLIFSEVTPKTLAAYYPEKIAFPGSYILTPLLKLFYPLVWLVSEISIGLLGLFGIKPKDQQEEQLSAEELRTVVNEAGGMIPKKHQKMLLNILDLENMTIDDIMVPRSEIVGIDLDDDIDAILNQLRTTQHTRIPVFRTDINNLVGLFHSRKLARLLKSESINKAELMQLTIEPYFIPSGTELNKQLLQFQAHKRRIAFVVDEYGDIQGLVTLEDLLEEIVGEFTTDVADNNLDISKQDDGSYVVDGMVTLRELNRHLEWELPTDGPKTLNGLVVEHLESIPDAHISVAIGEYKFEILQTKDNVIKTIRAFK